MKEQEEKNDSKKNSVWLLIIIFPIIWGLFGLLSGEGFFPYILKNIKALLILGIGLLALIGFLKLLDK